MTLAVIGSLSTYPNINILELLMRVTTVLTETPPPPRLWTVLGRGRTPPCRRLQPAAAAGWAAG